VEQGGPCDMTCKEIIGGKTLLMNENITCFDGEVLIDIKLACNVNPVLIIKIFLKVKHHLIRNPQTYHV
jgi:hypothetical protein